MADSLCSAGRPPAARPWPHTSPWSASSPSAPPVAPHLAALGRPCSRRSLLPCYARSAVLHLSLTALRLGLQLQLAPPLFLHGRAPGIRSPWSSHARPIFHGVWPLRALIGHGASLSLSLLPCSSAMASPSHPCSSPGRRSEPELDRCSWWSGSSRSCNRVEKPREPSNPVLPCSTSLVPTTCRPSMCRSGHLFDGRARYGPGCRALALTSSVALSSPLCSGLASSRAPSTSRTSCPV